MSWKILIKALQENNLTLGSIESMTGGLFASTITNNAGVSSVFKGSVVTYNTDIKTKLVGVKQDTVDTFTVVSPEVAEEMAIGGIKKLGCNVCVSITGNAGPSCEPGGKPVGHYCIGIAFKLENSTKIQCHTHCFQSRKKSRNSIRKEAVKVMKELLLGELVYEY